LEGGYQSLWKTRDIPTNPFMRALRILSLPENKSRIRRKTETRLNFGHPISQMQIIADRHRNFTDSIGQIADTVGQQRENLL